MPQLDQEPRLTPAARTGLRRCELEGGRDVHEAAAIDTVMGAAVAARKRRE